MAEEALIEEVLVKGVDRCGPWPIAHEAILDCEYPQLKRGQLDSLRALRAAYLEDCLACSETACEPRQLPAGARHQKFICRRLFQTPRWIPRTQLRVVDVGYVVARLKFDVSARGRVENIRIQTLDSDLEHSEVLELVTRAAEDIRFEPVSHRGRKMPLLNVEDGYILEP